MDTIGYSQKDLFLQTTLYRIAMQASMMGNHFREYAPMTTKGEPS